MYTRFDTTPLRDLERTPLLSQDVVVLSEKVKSYIQRLARELFSRKRPFYGPCSRPTPTKTYSMTPTS